MRGTRPPPPYTYSKYELRSYLESRWLRQSRLAPSETCGFERLLTHPLHSNSSIFNVEFELLLHTQAFVVEPRTSCREYIAIKVMA